MDKSRTAVVAGLAALLMVSGCGRKQAPPAQQPAAPPPASAAPASTADVIAAAVDDTTRPAEARARDIFRKPAEILAFSGVRPGQTVVEIAPGAGYDTALLSRVVGPTGKVYSVDSERLFEYMPKMRESFANYIAQDPRGNVEYSAQRLDALDLPANVDIVWMSMFYHDTVWLGVDRATMNRAIFEHLKPGGAYIVVDHNALPGAGEAVTKELHRIDAATVKSEIEAAGFKLAAMSDALANPDDPHTDSVFADERRGRTDRFVYKFVKPK
jgi:predicted methyltransferase